MAAIVTLFLTSSDAHAGFLSVTGAGNILDPSVTPTAATPNYFQDTGANKLIHGWNERQNVTLDRDIYVDFVHIGTYDNNNDLGGFNQLKIAKGTVVSSQMLYFDPKFQTSLSNVIFKFDAPILGVIVASDRFHNQAHGFADYFTASDFLGNPLTTYPAGHFEDRGLELNQADALTLSVSGDMLIFNLTANYPGDQIRVITGQYVVPTPVPAPPGIILGLTGVGLFCGRRVFRRFAC